MAVSDEKFIELFSTIGASATARELGINERSVYKRRKKLQERYDRPIYAPATVPNLLHQDRMQLAMVDGQIIVGSDAHYWPSHSGTTAHRAFVKFCKTLKPDIVVMNGDAFDGATISRHPSRDFSRLPSVAEELSAVTERLLEIEEATGKAKRIWCLGNHDIRLEQKLANAVPELADVKGTRQQDHFPEWVFTWALMINDDLMIKHRWKSGLHGVFNNAVHSGVSFCTGHLHSLKVTPWTDYNGTRYGIDTGTLSQPYSSQFSYAEENPTNHRPGFVVLTIKDKTLLWPEIVHVVEEGVYEWRGKREEV